MQIERRGFDSNLSTDRRRQVCDRIADCAPSFGTRQITFPIGFQKRSLCAALRRVEVGLAWWEYKCRVKSFTTNNERPASRLRHSVISSAQHATYNLEAHRFGCTHDLAVLERSQELRYVLHNKNLRSGPFGYLKEGSPKLLPRVAFARLIQEAESLARGPADYHIGFRDFGRRIIQDVYNVALKAMLAKVGAVGLDTEMVEIIRPHRIKCMPEASGEAERHAPGPGESVDQPKSFTLAREFSVRPEFVNALFLSDEPPTFYFAFRFIFHDA